MRSNLTPIDGESTSMIFVAWSPIRSRSRPRMICQSCWRTQIQRWHSSPRLSGQCSLLDMLPGVHAGDFRCKPVPVSSP